MSRSEFSASPQKRSDDKCLVHLYDEASVPITSVSVDYVMGKMVAGGFISVPVVIQDSGDDVSTGVIAASYLNTSIHQSKASHIIIKFLEYALTIILGCRLSWICTHHYG